MSFTFGGSGVILCGRDSCCGFFTLKIVGAVTDKQRDALWLPGTTSFPGLIWALVHPGFEGMGCSDASAGARHPSAQLCAAPQG